MYSTLRPYNSPAVSAIIDPPKKCNGMCGANMACKSSVCTCQSNYSLAPVQVLEPFHKEISTDLTWKTEKKITTSSPEVNGPPFWFVLHNGAAHLPEFLSPISAKRIQNFIEGIPEMQPCTNCSEHARSYIEKNKDLISTLNTRDAVFKFYVDFHNFVNQRLGKKIFTYEEAYAMYRDGVNVKIFKY